MPWGAVAAIGAAVVSNALAPDPKSPDYGPQAEASKYSADLSYQLGNRQLDQAQAQYDANMRIAQPVIDTQLKIMQQGLSQGDDYYNYGKSFRPLEQEMAAQARGGLTAADIVRMNKMGLGNLAQAAPRLPAPAAAPGAAPMPAAPAPSGGAVYGGTDRTIQPVDLTNPDVRRTAASAGGAIVAREQAAPTMVSAGGSFGGGGGSFGPTRVDEANGIRYYADGSSEKMGADELYAYQNRDKVQAALLQTTGNGGGGVQYHSPEPQGQGEPGLPRFVQNYNPQQIKEEAEAAERMRLQTQAAAPAQPGGMSAAEIAAATAAQRAGILTNATAAWQKQQDARRAELQKQLDAAKQEEQAIQAKAIADAQAKTAGLSMSYIDAQGNVRAADSYRNIKAGENAQGSSPGDGYSYFEFDNPDAGTKTPRTIQVGDSEQIVYDEAPARTGAWLKSGKVGVADPSLVGADPTQVDPKTLRSYQLKQQLDALAAEKFDSSKVDYSAADAAGGQAALDGAMVRAMMDQAEMDQITGTAQSNAARLAARTKAYEDESYKDITDYTGGDSGILNRYRSDIDADVGRAVADARYGQTAATNSAIRQAMRYGLNAPANTAGLATQQASQIAAAANNTRNSAIDNYRSLVGQGIGLKRDAFTTGQAATLDSMNKGEQALRAGRDMRIQNESLDWAKKLDVTGMARGMPGASQGAYSVATNAGNSAVSNQMAPGQALQGAMAQSANTQLQGRQIAQQGLGSILSSQTSQYGANSAAGTAQSGQMLNAIGTGLGYAFSDARLKRNVVKLSDDPRGFSWYEFEYLWGSRRHVGVMAHEVERVLPAAVIDIDGFKAVNYNLL